MRLGDRLSFWWHCWDKWPRLRRRFTSRGSECCCPNCCPYCRMDYETPDDKWEESGA